MVYHIDEVQINTMSERSWSYAPLPHKSYKRRNWKMVNSKLAILRSMQDDVARSNKNAELPFKSIGSVANKYGYDHFTTNHYLLEAIAHFPNYL
jgi:hypothetical protein